MKDYLTTTVRALATSLTNAFRRPVTVEFPEVIRPRAERYRASFALLHEEDGDEACIGCLQCERICPSQVISIKAGGKRESPITGKKRGYADDFVLDLNACIYCELCVQVCPTDAIVMTREPELPAFGREDLVLTMAKLYANEKAKHRAWGDATRLNGMQTPPKAPKAAAPASAAPAAGAPASSPAPRPAAESAAAAAAGAGAAPVGAGAQPGTTAPAPVSVAPAAQASAAPVAGATPAPTSSAGAVPPASSATASAAPTVAPVMSTGSPAAPADGSSKSGAGAEGSSSTERGSSEGEGTR